MAKNSLPTWYYRPGRDQHNFGDVLGSVLLANLGVKTHWVPPHEAEILTTGTILQQAKNWRYRDDVLVWGSGWAGDTHLPQERIHDLTGIRYLAVRGEVTRQHISRQRDDLTDLPLGDPGLLVSHSSQYGNSFTAQHEIGFVRHHADRLRYDWAGLDVFEIDAARHPDEVVPEIAQCSTIISTSLHGLIVADAFGIPSMRLETPMVGRPLKWVDHASALTLPVSEIQDRLLAALVKGGVL